MHARLADLFTRHFGTQSIEQTDLKAHGSSRKLYRLRSADGRTAIGVEYGEKEENAAFLSFSRHFRKAGIAVPEIYGEALDEGVYLEEDLGDTTLFDFLQAKRGGSEAIPEEVAALYRQAAAELARIQIEASRGLDYSLCYPHGAFDRRSMSWDLNYFKYYFLKLARIPFHEKRLELDFEALTEFLIQAPSDFFLFRDFQSRNIMVRDGRPWFIDYQGGRKGALPYDLASLLLDAKANLPFDFREEIKKAYLEAAGKLTAIEPGSFEVFYRAFSLIRIFQAMGAYGYRGFYERKAHFLQSVPYAVRNLEHLLSEGKLPIELPELWQVLHRIVASAPLRTFTQTPLSLTVRVESFSYKNGYPLDASGHGGGFVFDCRALPNPGREKRFSALTGRDAEVVSYLEQYPEVGRFVQSAHEMVASSIAAYKKRNFTYLSVAFGCTGGQHRSVYCAEALARMIAVNADLRVELRHREKDAWPTKQEQNLRIQR